MQDLKEVTRDIHYENFRSQKLSSTNTSMDQSQGKPQGKDMQVASTNNATTASCKY